MPASYHPRRLSHVCRIWLAGWCVLCLHAGCVYARSAEHVSLQLKWHHQFQFAGYYAAQAKGFYQQEGLQVEIVEGGKNNPPLTMVLTGAAQYGIGDSDIVRARMEGKPVVVLAAIFQHSPLVLLSRRDRQINTPGDLVGKTIMLSPDQGSSQVRAMFLKEGIDASRVNILPQSWNLDDLINGKVDAISAYAMVEPNELSTRGVEPSIMSTQEYGVDFYGDTLFTTQSEIRNHEERVQRFIRATQKGWEYALAHQEEIADLILELPGVAKRGITRGRLLAEAKGMEPYVLADVVEIGHINEGRWQHIAEILATLGIAPRQYDLAGFVYRPHEFADNRLTRWVLGVAALAALLLALAWLWSVQIRRQVRQRTFELQEEILRREAIEQALAASQQLVRATFDSAAVGISMTSQRGEFLLANPAYCQIVGYSEAELHKANSMTLTYPDDRAAYAEKLEKLQAGEIGTFFVEQRCIRGDGSIIWVQVGVSLLHGADGAPCNFIGITENITERRGLESFKAQQNALLQRVATGEVLKEVLMAAVQLVEDQYPHAKCSILLLDSQRRCFIDGVSAKLPPEFMRSIYGLQIGPAAGSCGTAAFEKCQVIVSDIANDLLWENYRELALAHGLRACWSVPIYASNQEVLGTFAVYTTTPYSPKPAELELLSASANVVGIVIERHQSQQHLRLLENCISRLNDIVLISEAEPFDEPGPRILFVNEAFERITGYRREEVIGKTPRILQGANTQKSELWKIRQALNAWQPVRAEVINYRKDGQEIWLELDIVPIADASGWYTHWVAVERDITQRKLAESKIQQLAFYDPMTSLPNRQLLMDRLQKVLAVIARTHHTGALLFIDLDNFKSLNDSYGHEYGDMLLMQVATRIAACVRDSDTVGRLGGDEFLVVLDDLDEQLEEAAAQARNVGEKILISFQQTFFLGAYEYHTTPSIGITLFNSEAAGVDELLRRADLAMYQAKASGRNAIRFFDPKMQEIINERVALEEDLRQALKRGEFLLHYQAQFDHEGRIIGAEALIRWQHPKRGMVSPAQFIPLAEDSGLILQIGQWVLASACVKLLQWAAVPQMAHLTLAVNVSARQFRQPDFVEQVIALVDNTGINPQRLKLELTESLLVENVEDIITKMTALKRCGVGFSLDDFGTGYSSLSYLKRLPLDQLKIDQSFVRDVLTDNNDASIVRTIIALGQSLGLAVIAEGVETEEQRQFLVRHGCLAYQGYLFSKPLPADEFEGLLEKY